MLALKVWRLTTDRVRLSTLTAGVDGVAKGPACNCRRLRQDNVAGKL